MIFPRRVSPTIRVFRRCGSPGSAPFLRHRASMLKTLPLRGGSSVCLSPPVSLSLFFCLPTLWAVGCAFVFRLPCLLPAFFSTYATGSHRCACDDFSPPDGAGISAVLSASASTSLSRYFGDQFRSCAPLEKLCPDFIAVATGVSVFISREPHRWLLETDV